MLNMLSWQSSHVLIVLTVEVIVLYSACMKLMLSSYSQLEISAGPVISVSGSFVYTIAFLTGPQEVLDVLI
jgi:hypothetical protein